MKRTVLATAAGLLVLAAVAYYYFVDPLHPAGPVPSCWFRGLTGWDCPGCGFQRAVHALLHGRWADAWHFNPFVFFAVPVGAAYVLAELRPPSARVRRVMFSPVAVGAIIVAILAWWVGRNVI